VNDVSKNLRAYIFTQIDGNITFGSNVPCFTKAPPNQAFPYIVVKTSTFTPDHTKDKSGGIYQVDIEVNTRFEKNRGGQDDCDDISNEIMQILSPLGRHTSTFGNNSMYLFTGPNILPLEDDDDNFHYYSKRLTYEAHVLGDATDASAITAFSYSNNGQTVESSDFVTMVPSTTPSVGTFNYYVDANDTLPIGLSLNEDTGYITRTGTIGDGSYSFDVILVGSGLASGVASVSVTLTVAAVGPVLSNPIDISTGSTTGSGTVDTDTGNGTLYWVVTQSATSPSVAQVQAGQNDGGTAADDSGSQAVSGTGTQNVSFTGLSSGTTYYAHYNQQDSQADNSNVSTADGFITDRIDLIQFTQSLGPDLYTDFTKRISPTRYGNAPVIVNDGTYTNTCPGGIVDDPDNSDQFLFYLGEFLGYTTVGARISLHIGLKSNPFDLSTDYGVVLSGAESYDTNGCRFGCVLNVGGTIYYYYVGIDASYKWRICLATSADGRSFTKQGVVLDYNDVDEKSVSGPFVVREGNAWYMIYTGWDGLSSPANNNPGESKIGIKLATSTDGTSWVKTETTIIPLGTSGTYDDNKVEDGQLRKYGDTWVIMYNCNDGLNWKIAMSYSKTINSVFTKYGLYFEGDAATWETGEVVACPVVHQFNGKEVFYYQAINDATGEDTGGANLFYTEY
jgi:predicted GH43/DUF377 family glycosyl hydrolase